MRGAESRMKAKPTKVLACASRTLLNCRTPQAAILYYLAGSFTTAARMDAGNVEVSMIG